MLLREEASAFDGEGSVLIEEERTRCNGRRDVSADIVEIVEAEEASRERDVH